MGGVPSDRMVSVDPSSFGWGRRATGEVAPHWPCSYVGAIDSHVAVTFAVVVTLFTLASVTIPVTIIRIAAGAIFVLPSICSMRRRVSVYQSTSFSPAFCLDRNGPSSAWSWPVYRCYRGLVCRFGVSAHHY